jgi:hypothetical protein
MVAYLLVISCIGNTQQKLISNTDMFAYMHKKGTWCCNELRIKIICNTIAKQKCVTKLE